MTDQQLAECLAFMAIAWPGLDWNISYCLFWSDIFDDYKYEVVVESLKTMSREERFPNAAAFVELADTATRANQPRHPGSPGYVNGVLPPAPDEIADKDVVVKSISEARKRLHGKRGA